MQAPPRMDPGGGSSLTHLPCPQNTPRNPCTTQSLAQAAMPVVYLQPTEDQIQSNAQSVHVQPLVDCARLQVQNQNFNSNLEQLDEVRSEGPEDHVVFTKSMQIQGGHSVPNLIPTAVSDQIQSSQKAPPVQTVKQDSVVIIFDPSSPQRPVVSAVDAGDPL